MAYKLSLLVPHMDDELPVDFCARLAIRNFQSASEFALDMGFRLDDLRRNKEDALVRLAEVSGRPLPCLHDAAFRNLGKRYFIRGQALDGGSLRLRHFAVCPECLQEDIATSDVPPAAAMRLRSHWMLASIGVCMEHHLVLATVGERLVGQVRRDWSQVAPSLTPHLARIRKTSSRRAPTRFETYLFDRLNRKTQGNWVDGLEFFVAERTARMFGLVATTEQRADGTSAGGGQFCKVDEAGYLVIRGGPPNICELLSKIERKNYEKRLLKKKSPTPAYLYGCIYERLRRNSVIPEFAPVIDVVSEHIVSNFPLAPGDLVFNRPVSTRCVHSIHTLSKELDVSDRRVRNVLTAAGLLPYPGRRDREAVVDAAKAEALMRAEMDGISQAAAEQHLNIAKIPMEKLIRKGIIVRHRHSTGTQGYRFFKSELDAFLQRLMYGAIPIASKDVGDLLSIQRASPVSRCQAADIVKLILDRKLRKIGVMADAIGFDSILVDPQEIRALFPDFDVPGLSPGEVAARLQTDPKVIHQLVERKLIDAHFGKNRMSGAVNMRLTEAAVEAFTARYVSLFHLAKECGRGGKRLKRELAAVGVLPAKETEGLIATFYRRSDLPNL